MKQPHHRGTYHVRSRLVVAHANANPDTRCWRCHLTLAEHTPHPNGRAAFWTAGHINDGEVDGVLMPEASTCNFNDNGRKSRSQWIVRKYKNKTSRQW